MIKKVLDLEVFQISYQLAMEIFKVTRIFPKEERYSLADQILRSSESVSANVAEGWEKDRMKMILKTFSLRNGVAGGNKSLGFVY